MISFSNLSAQQVLLRTDIDTAIAKVLDHASTFLAQRWLG